MGGKNDRSSILKGKWRSEELQRVGNVGGDLRFMEMLRIKEVSRKGSCKEKEILLNVGGVKDAFACDVYFGLC